MPQTLEKPAPDGRHPWVEHRVETGWNYFGTIHPRTPVACSATSTHMKSSSTRLQPTTLRKMSPSLPAMPTADAAIARFCGLIILPSTPPEELAAASSSG